MIWTMNTIAALIATTACAFVATLTYSRLTKKIPHVWYVITTIGVGFWSLSTFLFVSGLIDDNNYILFRVVGLGTFSSQIAFIKWSQVINTNRTKFDNFFVNSLIAFAIFLSILSFSDSYLYGMAKAPINSIFAIPGPLYKLFALLCFLCCFFGVYLMYKEMLRHKDRERLQLKYIISISIAMYCAGFGWFLFVYRYNCPLPIVVFFVVLSTTLMAYAILRNRLMDMAVIRHTIVYSILISIITLGYFIIIYLSERLFSTFFGYHSLPMAIGTIAFFSLIFNPLKNKLQIIVDKYFFRGSIDQINEENIKLRDELQKTEKMKAVATLAAGMAHEIKNPLTSIKTFTEYLNKKKNEPGFLEKYEKIVGKEVDRINYIVKELLEFSKPSDLKLQKTDINALLDETLALLSNDFISKNIKTEKRYAEIAAIEIDPNQVKQVFLNLFLNAKDAMPDGGILSVKTYTADSKILTSITDTGKGIAQEDLKHIFDPFFTKKDGETGLGLSVVHGIVEKHGGKIEVKSTVEKGTEFTLLLPYTA